MKFVRTHPAPTVSGGYTLFRPYVRADFIETCAYCLLSELFAAGQQNFELDHFFPAAKFPGRKQDFYNLYYACHPCNHIKRAKWPDPQLEAQGVGFVDLCQDNFENHFKELPDGHWEGLTESAKYTIDALRLNRLHLVQIRLLLRKLAEDASASDGN
jgi:hypothetical protein